MVNVRTDGAEVGQEVESEPQSVASEVRGSRDWDRRYALMRTHTTLDMLAGVLNTSVNGTGREKQERDGAKKSLIVRAFLNVR
jgi:Ser-tRNA(Ala) deacylase AlaX